MESSGALKLCEKGTLLEILCNFFFLIKKYYATTFPMVLKLHNSKFQIKIYGLRKFANCKLFLCLSYYDVSWYTFFEAFLNSELSELSVVGKIVEQNYYPCFGLEKKKNCFEKLWRCVNMVVCTCFKVSLHAIFFFFFLWKDLCFINILFDLHPNFVIGHSFWIELKYLCVGGRIVSI